MFWAVTLLGPLLLVALVGEVFVRLRFEGLAAKHHFDPGIYAPDPERVWALRAGYQGDFVDYTRRAATSTNSLGYRGPEETPERLGAALRVLVVGDSVAFGRGVADGEPYPERLEALLREQGLDAAVFNLAVPGYDTLLERITLEQNLDRIDPHVVLLGWYRNDATENSDWIRTQPLQVIDGYLVADEEAYREYKARIGGGLRESAFLNFLSGRWKLYRKSLRLERRVEEVRSGDGAGLAFSVDELTRIRDLCRERGIPFVLVVHPAHDELLAGIAGSAPAALAEGLGSRGSGAMADTRVVSVADTWDDGEGMYLPGDRCHPSAEGHDSIARFLAERPVWGAVVR